MAFGFDELTPYICMEAAEAALGEELDGSISPYQSYVNRVYGFRSVEGRELVCKFYRPGRWSRRAILEEHQFLADCADADVPVVPPLANQAGRTLSRLSFDVEEGGEVSMYFAVFPKMGGRSFDPETEEAWLRLGALIGRCHLVGKLREAEHRPRFLPQALTAGYVQELLDAKLVHPDVSGDFQSICEETIERTAPLFAEVELQRTHGDCHRGNFLDRLDQGLLLIDFDDMMMAPAVQDIWLMLPGHLEDSYREVNLLLEGYEQFTPFPRRTLSLIEPLRFMRMIYFLTWRARQRHDKWFKAEFPDWGSKSFWVKEIEDLSLQAQRIG
jgi:Ser/Thr protein kinase RdoA (MazF antagonist)